MEPNFPDIILYAIPFFLLTIGLEVWLAKKTFDLKYTLLDSVASLSMGIGNLLTGIVSKIISLGAYYFIYQFALFDIEVNWWSWLLLLFLEDHSYYWMHRVSHEVRFFWASHVIHHSSTHYNLSTALRQTWTGSFFSHIFWWPLALLGFHPLFIVFQQSVSLLYQYWIHTEAIGRLGVFEKFMNTPSHHRVHHGSDKKYLDKNHGGIFIIWDRLYKTFKEEEETPIYGITTPLNSYNPIKIAFHEWADIAKDVYYTKKFRYTFKYIFGPPGWSPNQKD